MLALRTVKGLNISQFNKQFNCDFESEYAPALTKKRDFLIRDGDYLKIKEEFLYVQNDILLEFMKD